MLKDGQADGKTRRSQQALFAIYANVPRNCTCLTSSPTILNAEAVPLLHNPVPKGIPIDGSRKHSALCFKDHPFPRKVRRRLPVDTAAHARKAESSSTPH